MTAYIKNSYLHMLLDHLEHMRIPVKKKRRKLPKSINYTSLLANDLYILISRPICTGCRRRASLQKNGCKMAEPIWFHPNASYARTLEAHRMFRQICIGGKRF